LRDALDTPGPLAYIPYISNIEIFSRRGIENYPTIPERHCHPIIARGRKNAVTTAQQPKPYKGWAMEGLIARWYARNTGKSLEPFRKEANEIAQQLSSGSSVLEVAPGPGFLAIELAKLGSFNIVGLDISQSFVRIATENALKAGVEVIFREGNASSMPFESDTFDFVCCRAAFKNFSEPVQALHEMHRVLKPGGQVLIHDLRRDAAPDAIKAAVKEMGLGWLSSLLTRWILRRLRRRAYSQEDFRQMVAQTPFRTSKINFNLIGLELSLWK
jgi:ubiquinone/menaquinone biosynthesis C-methylase UbiE